MARPSTDDALPGEVRSLLRSGLPVRVEHCGSELLGLRGVKARAQRPNDQGSRARALDGLLREQLNRLENADLAPAARLLFGAEAATSGATLTARRTAAAEAAGYEVHHFRKRIEPKLLDLVAWQLRRDSEEFAAARHTQPPELHIGSGPLVLPPDVFAWEAAEHQHALASLWGAVYLLRAELLTVAQLRSMQAAKEDLNVAATTALWRHALVLRISADYRASYGAILLHARSEIGPEVIGASAGWTPDLTPAQELLLSSLADPAGGLMDFTARLHAADGGAELATNWRQALIGQPRPNQEEQSA